MVKTFLCLGAAGCISVSASSPNGGYGIVEYTVVPADGPGHTVTDAGRLEFGSLGNGGCGGSGGGGDCGDGASVVAYDWVGNGLVPLWAPDRVVFDLPDWDAEGDVFLGPIPLANLACPLHRTQRRPTVFVATCGGPDGGPFDVELILDR